MRLPFWIVWQSLSKVISSAVMEQALIDTNYGQRDCRLSHRVMLWVVLAMGVLTEYLPIRQVFKNRADECDRGIRRRHVAICARRDKRLGVAPVQRVFELVVRPLATPQTPGAFYHDLRLVGIDGTVLDVPDTLSQ